MGVLVDGRIGVRVEASSLQSPHSISKKSKPPELQVTLSRGTPTLINFDNGYVISRKKRFVAVKIMEMKDQHLQTSMVIQDYLNIDVIMVIPK